jgi:hypothetical protein
MSKYKVGNELLIVESVTEDVEKLKNLTKLSVEGDLAQISWGVKIIKVEYDKPNVILTYRNVYGEINKVFAVCKDVENFDEQKVLEKALLKAFQMEIMNISVLKNSSKTIF